MIDLSEEPVAENIETTAKYLKRAAPMKASRANPAKTAGQLEFPG